MESHLSVKATAALPTLPTDKKEAPLARASRVANAVVLEAVRFTQFGAQRHVSSEVTGHELLPLIRFTQPKVTRGDGGAFAVSSVFTASFALAGSGDRPAVDVATVRATVELKYIQSDLQQAFVDEDLDEFVMVNVPFNSWGYWREFVQSSMARLGLPPVTIPLFRVQVAREWMLRDEA